MNELSKPHRVIRDQLVGKTGVKALVVEGDDDRDFIEALLDQKSPGWESNWVVGSAKGKGHVLKILALEPQWIGLVDRDEWSHNAVATATAAHPNLHILPRFCMESYFLLAEELWAALPAVEQAKVSGGEAAFQNAIHADLNPWVRHGALWHAVNPLWDGIRAKGFKDALLDLQAAQDDAVIQQKLCDWHEHLDPMRIFDDFKGFLQRATAELLEKQLTEWVHGKKRFSEHVVPVLNRFIGQQPASKWFKDLLRTMPVPADLDSLWTKMIL